MSVRLNFNQIEIKDFITFPCIFFITPRIITSSDSMWELKEPQHVNTRKMATRPAKTGICPVWSEFSLSAWRKLRSLATHKARSEDWSDWGDAQADLLSCHAAAQISVTDNLSKHAE